MKKIENEGIALTLYLTTMFKIQKKKWSKTWHNRRKNTQTSEKLTFHKFFVRNVGQIYIKK